MEKFSIENVSDYQILLIRNALNSYLFIQDHANEPDSWEFRKAFLDFYGGNRVFDDDTKKGAYFGLFNDQITLEGALNAIKRVTGKMQYSYATKAIHTMLPAMPIYDRNVKEYLKAVYGRSIYQGASIEQIKKSYKSLCDWYRWFIEESGELPAIKEWFVKTFGVGEPKLTATKMVDLIIWSYVKEQKARNSKEPE